MTITSTSIITPLQRYIFRFNCKTKCQHRTLTNGVSIIHKKFGDPREVLEKTEFEIPQNVPPKKILVQILAAPINPADINTVQGVYGIKPRLPAVGGFEGVGKVLKVGEGVTKVVPGDWLIPTAAEGQSTWTTHGVWNENEIIKVANDISVISAATLSVNPSTSFRILNDFVKLQKGDVVIQNGANSGVGQSVIQMCRHYGLISVNVIRNRPDLDQVKEYLTQLGANYIVTEEDLRQQEAMKFLKSHPPSKLGLNCVGGKATTELIKYLSFGATLVTYGAMSRQPLIVGASSLIFKDLNVRGFWMTNWKKSIGVHSKEWHSMIDSLVDMCRKKTLLPPLHDVSSLEDYKSAVSKAMEPFVGRKQIFVNK